MSNFVNLHVHTEYSLLDGACRLKNLVSRVKELGQKAVAITDHGVMYGVIDFYKECKSQGIKPIIGCEVYVAPRTRFDKQHRIDSSPYHLILLCKNETGYKNLIKLVSAGYIDGFYNKPRIDRELLEKHHEGLIALSACLAGEIPRNLSMGDYTAAKKVADYYHSLFGEGNFYLEIMNHGLEDQIRILPLMQKLSKETGIPMVATNDSHYILKEDSKMQNVLVCIATNRTVHDESSMEFATEEFYIKSEEEMTEIFESFEGAIDNTSVIAEQCSLDFTFGEIKLPKFDTPNGEDNNEYFKEMCYRGLYKHYGEKPEETIIQRLEYELGTIISMGYVDYYLIVHDFIDYARKQDIPVGPGRGSGAGSLAAYCTGITGVDPIKYNLIFERFLNPERISMPDFDIDFCYERRQEVIDYVVRKYGEDHVAQIITFGTMAARGALRDVGRALGVSYSTVDAIAKSVPFELGMTIDLALQTSEFKTFYNASTENKELIDTARKVEGMARHASTHAAGVVITPLPADSYVPLQKNDESIVTQFTMGTLEELGLIKMDFLGLRNLTVIREVEDIVKKTIPDFSIENIPLDDLAVFEMLGAGQTNGVFQFESGGMKSVLTQLKPEHMEDIIAVISLYRPGPMDSIPTYIKNRHNPQLVTYKHPLLTPILDVTYGCIVYQEQVMEICRKLAGYSYGRADLVRRAMSKKIHEVMEEERHNFVYGATRKDGSMECPGAVANGVPSDIANSIFDEMSSFASYAFNKSHAAAYALIAYQTAYLKCHYPQEYMAALLTSILDNSSKVIDYTAEAKKMKINVLPPAINESYSGFKVVDGNILFGLMAVKNLGRGFISDMVKEREENGRFTDMLNFFERMYGHDLNRRVVEGLIKCGALDEFGHTRKEMISGFESILSSVETDHKNNISGQMDLFGSSDTDMVKTYTLPDVGEYSLMQRLSMERDSCGLYLSGHPLDEYSRETQKLGAKEISSFSQKDACDGDLIRVIAVVNSKRINRTRNNENMAFSKIEDKSGIIEVIIFPKIYLNVSDILSEGSVIFLRGRLKISPEEETQIICEDITTVESAIESYSAIKTSGNYGDYNNSTGKTKTAKNTDDKNSKKGVYLKLSTKGSQEEEKIISLLEKNKGNTPIYFYYIDTKKYIRTPRRLWATITDELSENIISIVGENNVATIK